MRVTNALSDTAQYTYDQTNWSCTEFWQFASETNVIGRGDCEDKAIIGLVGAMIAGIPFEMLRLVAGMTFSNEGHCTMFYFASDLRWHHRNSTTIYSPDKDPTTLPLTGDGTENLNIQRVWFSATQNKTFTTFDPTAATAYEQKDGIFKFFKWTK
jgi:transglutaminase-like putative cysteine protease